MKPTWMGSAIPEQKGKFPILFSYAYMRKLNPDKLDRLLTNKNTEVLIDSGAFTALNAGNEISLSEYMDFLKTYKKNLFGYFALDKLGDPSTTKKNLETMLKNGLNPLPIHVRGADKKAMDELFQYSDWIGLGGFRRPHRGPASKEYVKQKMEWAKNRNVHWLGYTTRNMVYAFKPYSVDCSSWHMPLKYGKLKIYYGNGEWGQPLSVKDFQEKKYSSKDMYVISRCGFKLEQAIDPDCWINSSKKTMLHFHVSVYSWIQYILDVRKQIGTRLFMAVEPNSHGEEIARWLNKLSSEEKSDVKNTASSSDVLIRKRGGKPSRVQVRSAGSRVDSSPINSV